MSSVKQSIEQLYKDISAVHAKNSGGIAEEPTCTLFNACLAEAKKEMPNDPIIASVPQANAKNTRNSELLTMTGQILARLPPDIPMKAYIGIDLEEV